MLRSSFSLLYFEKSFAEKEICRRWKKLGLRRVFRRSRIEKSMKIKNFPFTAIKGQDRMKMALLLNVIDPRIGGVLLTGQQGTGKTTAVRALIDILPSIQVHQGCVFNCKPNAPKENLCSFCQTAASPEIIEKSIPFVNLPLGVTEEMVVGSLDVEQILQQGQRVLQPGLLAKANRGILYVDEINLLQDHIVDILLDASAMGVNYIEREGISIVHPAKFVLVGSMNPEEGELRPQIQDRLGLEVTIRAPADSKTRALITRDVIEFNDNPGAFIEKYAVQQKELRERLIKSKKLVSQIQIPSEIYEKISQIVIASGIYSQRADITVIRCARAHAAYMGRDRVKVEDFENVIDLVFGHRLRVKEDTPRDPKYVENEVMDILGKIKEAIENTDLYSPNMEREDNILKHTPETQEEYKENPLNDENWDLPEWDDEGGGSSKNRYTDREYDVNPPGFKVGKTRPFKGKLFASSVIPFDRQELKEIDNIFRDLRKRRKIGKEFGRGSRVHVQSLKKGGHIRSRKFIKKPHSIDFNGSIKNLLRRKLTANMLSHTHSAPFSPKELNNSSILPLANENRKLEMFSHSSPLVPKNTAGQTNPLQLTFPLQFKPQDIQEKIYESRAPLTVYFVIDASFSMESALKQTVEVLKSMHAEGYKKKDKVAVLTFFNKEVFVLQQPSVTVTKALKKIQQIQGQSYTPMAAALHKVLKLIRLESLKNRDNIPVIVMMSDMGANISVKYPDLEAKTLQDFRLITDELKDLAKKIGKKQIHTVILQPRKSYATRNLGIHPQSATEIIENFQKFADAEVFEFDLSNPQSAIIKLSKLL